MLLLIIECFQTKVNRPAIYAKSVDGCIEGPKLSLLAIVIQPKKLKC